MKGLDTQLRRVTGLCSMLQAIPHVDLWDRRVVCHHCTAFFMAPRVYRAKLTLKNFFTAVLTIHSLKTTMLEQP